MKHIVKFKKFLERYQLPMFDHKPNPRDIAKTFINKFKSTESLPKPNSNLNISDWNIGYGFMDGTYKPEIYKSILLRTIKECDNEVYFDGELYDKFRSFVKSQVAPENEEETLRNIDEEIKGNTDRNVDQMFGMDFLDSFYKHLINKNLFYLLLPDHNIEAISNYFWKISKNKQEPIIYRAITISTDNLNNDVEDYNGVGVFWSYDKTGAVAHSGGSGHDITLILEARIQPENIDWENTLFKSWWNLSDEKEVELVEGTSIEILGFFVESDDIKMLHQKDVDYLNQIFNNDYKKVSGPSNILLNKYSEFRFDEPITVKA